MSEGKHLVEDAQTDVHEHEVGVKIEGEEAECVGTGGGLREGYHCTYAADRNKKIGEIIDRKKNRRKGGEKRI